MAIKKLSDKKALKLIGDELKLAVKSMDESFGAIDAGIIPGTGAWDDEVIGNWHNAHHMVTENYNRIQRLIEGKKVKITVVGDE